MMIGRKSVIAPQGGAFHSYPPRTIKPQLLAGALSAVVALRFPFHVRLQAPTI